MKIRKHIHMMTQQLKFNYCGLYCSDEFRNTPFDAFFSELHIIVVFSKGKLSRKIRRDHLARSCKINENMQYAFIFFIFKC